MESRSLTPAEIQTLDALRHILKQRRGKRLWTVSAVLISVIAVLYAVPVGIEALLLRHTSPWTCILLGDMAGCGVLFLLGHRIFSTMLYLIATGFEAYLLAVHSISSESLIWITNLLPALAVAYLVLARSSSLVWKGRSFRVWGRIHPQTDGRNYTVAPRG